VTAPGINPPIDALTKSRIVDLEKEEKNGVTIIRDLGVFIDTHRDQPHVGVFYEDIHRGQCRPVKVDYLIEDDAILDQTTGKILPRHEKFMFVTEEFFANFLVEYMIEHGGKDPRDGQGCLPTSHFRDARAKIFHLKSFREIIRLRSIAEAAGKKRVRKS
jgi:hypothetical protein